MERRRGAGFLTTLTDCDGRQEGFVVGGVFFPDTPRTFNDTGDALVAHVVPIDDDVQRVTLDIDYRRVRQ